MTISKKRFKTMDEYIAAFPKNVRDILKKLRQTIRESAPQAEDDDKLWNTYIQTQWKPCAFRRI